MASKLFLVAILALAVLLPAASAHKPKTLVILDSFQTKSTHSDFFNSLSARGHSLTFREAYDDNVHFEKYGEFLFDNLVIFSPNAEDFGPTMSVGSIVRFVDSGRNVLLAVSNKVSEPVRELAYELGFNLEEDGTQVIDHVHYDTSDSGSHTKILSTSVLSNKAIFRQGVKAPVLYNGISHTLVPSSRQFLKLLTGNPTTYSAASSAKKLDDVSSSSTGSNTLLVSAWQSRLNARVTVVGSLDIFSNQYLNSPVTDASSSQSYDQSGNFEFIQSISLWTFGERGILRHRELSHKSHQTGVINPQTYRLTDTTDFSVIIEEYDGMTGTWQPFQADDMQLEFIMLDPYIRTALQHDGTGRFFTTFKIPDVYGVFKFSVQYHRYGYSFLEFSHVVPVRPYRHDEYDRFIFVAYPYYISAFSLMAAFFVFGLVFLYNNPSQKKQKQN